MSDKQREIDAYFERRDRMNKQHRIMTIREYEYWCMAGDDVSHPSSTGALAGGVTILFNTEPYIIGRFGED